MYALTMTKAQIDSLKILTSEKKVTTHEIVKNEAIALFSVLVFYMNSVQIVSKFRHVVLP